MADIEKVIKGLEACRKTDCINCSYSALETEVCLIKSLLTDALELLKEQPKWIPVDERLPEEDGFYLVCTRGFLPWIAELKTFMGIRGWCNRANMPVVKMWMPLQKTPEDGEQE